MRHPGQGSACSAARRSGTHEACTLAPYPGSNASASRVRSGEGAKSLVLQPLVHGGAGPMGQSGHATIRWQQPWAKPQPPRDRPWPHASRGLVALSSAQEYEWCVCRGGQLANGAICGGRPYLLRRPRTLNLSTGLHSQAPERGRGKGTRTHALGCTRDMMPVDCGACIHICLCTRTWVCTGTADGPVGRRASRTADRGAWGTICVRMHPGGIADKEGGGSDKRPPHGPLEPRQLEFLFKPGRPPIRHAWTQLQRPV